MDSNSVNAPTKRSYTSEDSYQDYYYEDEDNDITQDILDLPPTKPIIQKIDELSLLQQRTTELLQSKNITSEWLYESRHIMTAWARQYSNPHPIESLLKKIIDALYNKELQRTPPKYSMTAMYNALMEAWVNVGNVQRAEDILRAMVGYEDESSFGIVISGYVNTTSTDQHPNMEKAEEIFQYYSLDRRECITSKQWFRYLIQIYAYSKPPNAQRAEDLLRAMHYLYHEYDMKCMQLTVSDFIPCLMAWSQCQQPKRAEKLLNDMIDLYRLTGVEELKPTRKCFAIVIRAYALCATRDYKKAAQRAEALLAKMNIFLGSEELKTNTIYFTTVLNAYARLGLASRADALFTKMTQNIYYDGIQPNTVQFNMVLHAYAQSRAQDAAKNAEYKFNLYEKMYRQGNPGIGLIKPNSVGLSIVIKAWSYSGGLRGAKRANQLLERMERLYNLGYETMKPDIRSFQSVMNAWARCAPDAEDSAVKALNVLQKMEDLYEKTGQLSLKPDRQCYAAVINAYSKSKNPAKAQEVQKLLQRMKELYAAGNKDIKPDFLIYNTVMNTVAFSITDRQKALERTYQIFKDLEEYDVPDHVIYCTFLRACCRLIPANDPTRDQIVSAIFRKCCREGKVSRTVLHELKKAASKNLYSKLIPKDMENVKDLPMEWRRNIRSMTPVRAYR